MEIIIGKKYKHIKYHSYIKVEIFKDGRFRGIGFYRNDNNCVGIGDMVLFNTLDYKSISHEEFEEELTKIEQEISNRFYKEF